MLVEGVALYLLCTKGFMKHRDMRIKYFLLGWGVPAVIVTVSLAAQFPAYGHGPQYRYIWASSRENLSSEVCEQHRCRPACASAQSDQRLCYSHIGK